MKAKKRYRCCLVILLLLPCLAFADDSGIRVSGSATVSTVPDLATFTFALEGRGQDLPVVKEDIDARTARLVQLCKSLDIPTNKITATEVSIRPQYHYQNKTLLGYQVSRTLTVTLADLANYSALVNGAIESGITTIRNIIIDTSQRDELQRHALETAVRDAGRKARIIARGAGVKLGRLLSVTEGGTPMKADHYRLLSRETAVAGNVDVVEPGEITVTATVVVNYAIE